MTPPRRYAAVATAGALCLLLAGCVSLPRDGAVVNRDEQETVEQADAGFDFTPSGPRRGAEPADIIEGFLLSMQASPQSYAVAREFLSSAARTDWNPENATLIYGTKLLRVRDDDVRLNFEETVQLDSRGTWVGPTGAAQGIRYRLRLVQEEGEWRLANPPDAVIIPQTHFEARYQQYQVYFFDPTAEVLAPQPVYLPEGDVAPTLLLRHLLRGPAPALDTVLRSFVPSGTDLELSVPVSREGVAEVPLSRQILDLNSADLEHALAQIAWTLRQVPGIERMRVTVDGAPIEIPGGGSPQNVGAWAEFDPAIHWASQELFGLRNGNPVALAAQGGRAVEGRFGAQEFVLRDIAVDLPAERVAGVTEDGTTVVVAPRSTGQERVPGPDESTVVLDSRADLAQPAWDVHGQLWLLDRAGGSAQLMVRRNGVVRTVEAPGISGERVSSFIVSRDGTRVVATVEARAGDRLVIARTVRGKDGAVRGLTRAEQLPIGDVGVDDIRDIAWRSPSGVAVLTGPTPGSSQVLLALVDGSSGFDADGDRAEIFRERADRLVSAPGTPLYIATDRRPRFYELAADGQWVGLPPRGLRVPTFAG